MTKKIIDFFFSSEDITEDVCELTCFNLICVKEMKKK